MRKAVTEPRRYNYSGTPGADIFSEPSEVVPEDTRGVNQDRPTLVNGGARPDSQGVIGAFLDDDNDDVG